MGDAYALVEETRDATFQCLIDEVPAEFPHLAQIQAPYRIVEPGAGNFASGGTQANYYTSFIDAMWANNGLTMTKPGANGEGLGSYLDISAEIFRHVGSEAGSFSPDGTLLNQTLWTSSSTFYTAAPANYDAKFWHDHGIDGKAYGFPDDDVGGYSTYISHANPRYLLVAVGW